MFVAIAPPVIRHTKVKLAKENHSNFTQDAAERRNLRSAKNRVSAEMTLQALDLPLFHWDLRLILNVNHCSVKRKGAYNNGQKSIPRKDQSWNVDSYRTGSDINRSDCWRFVAAIILSITSISVIGHSPMAITRVDPSVLSVWRYTLPQHCRLGC